MFFFKYFPLSDIISRSSVNHKLYADDTQLFLSFSPCNFPQTFNSYKTPSLKSPGWLPTFFLSIPLKLNFYSLVFLHSSLKLKILLYLCLQTLPSNRLLLPEILVLSLTEISPSLITSHTSQKPARSHSWSQTYSQYFRSHSCGC